MTIEHPDVRRAVGWLAEQQRPDGTWASAYRSRRNPHADEWVTYAAARALQRLRGE